MIIGGGKMAEIRKGILNTTINEDILDDFREYCRSINCPMNMVLETFMSQFSKGQFAFKLAKNRMELDVEDPISN